MWKEIILPVLILCAMFILLLVAWGVGWYFYYRALLTAGAVEEIARLEAEEGEGQEKMKKLVAFLYTLLPAFVRNKIGEDSLSSFAQSVFDKMKAYAIARAKSSVKGENEAVEESRIDSNRESV
ncbi:MAG: hypothetical protein ACI4U2_04150 [Christensenellaceae bacterium]